jgi:hypothetical protein
MSKNMSKRATKCKSALENSILKFLIVSSVSSDSIVKGIIDDIKTAVKTSKKQKENMKKLTRRLLEEWKQRFPWLRTTDYKGTTRLKCASCMTAKLDNVWTNDGTVNIQISAILRHNKSLDHDKAEKIILVANNNPVTKGRQLPYIIINCFVNSMKM